MPIVQPPPDPAVLFVPPLQYSESETSTFRDLPEGSFKVSVASEGWEHPTLLLKHPGGGFLVTESDDRVFHFHLDGAHCVVMSYSNMLVIMMIRWGRCRPRGLTVQKRVRASLI